MGTKYQLINAFSKDKETEMYKYYKTITSTTNLYNGEKFCRVKWTCYTLFILYK